MKKIRNWIIHWFWTWKINQVCWMLVKSFHWNVCFPFVRISSTDEKWISRHKFLTSKIDFFYKNAQKFITFIPLVADVVKLRSFMCWARLCCRFSFCLYIAWVKFSWNEHIRGYNMASWKVSRMHNIGTLLSLLMWGDKMFPLWKWSNLKASIVLIYNEFDVYGN